MHTTLNAIRAADVYDRDADIYECDWKKLLTYVGKTAPDDEPLPVATIIDCSDLEYTSWVLGKACGDAGRNLCATFAADCVERVLHLYEEKYPTDDRPRCAILLARIGSDPAARDLACFVEDEAYSAATEAYNSARYDADAFVAYCVAVSAASASAAVRCPATSAYSAAERAAWAVSEAAAYAAADAARAAERAWQIDRLRKLIASQ